MKSLVLFDGVCNLCSGFVQFVIKREVDSSISFASLQSWKGEQVLKEYGVDLSMDSIVFIHEGNAYTKSRAFFMIVQHLKKPWPYVGIFSFLPVKFTDAAYDLIAKNRYRLMGKKNSCWLPSKNISSRFLDTTL